MAEDLKQLLKSMSTEDLEKLSEKCHAVGLGTHTVGSCISALSGIDVDIELSMRRREAAVAGRPQEAPASDLKGGE